jgi:hypothetical protein
MKSSEDPNERYLGITGVIIAREYESGQFTANLNAIKQDIFGSTDFALHRRDLIDKNSAPFDILKDEAKKAEFDKRILELIDSSTYRSVSVLIDKKEHKEKYVVWQFQPYHYCMTVLLERYVRHLHCIGETGDVVAESRGKKENKQLSESYRRIWERGTDHVPKELFQQHLTSREIKIRSKTANIAGLQLADLIANPACRELICSRSGVKMTAPFGRSIVNILHDKKYLRSPYGKVGGWGTKILP